MTARLLAPVAVALLLVATGCGGKSEAEKQREKGLEKAADRSTCLADAKKVSSFPSGFPQDFPFPPKTVVFDTQDRGAGGVVATGITSLPFKEVLASLNGPAQQAGFKVTNGETEAHDAEANWTGNGYRGRWAIRESASCAGETVVQVLASKK